MDTQTAKRCYNLLNSKSYLNEEEQSLFDDAEMILDDCGLLNKEGEIIEEDMGWEKKYSQDMEFVYTISLKTRKEGERILLSEGYRKIDDESYRKTIDGYPYWAMFRTGKWFLN